MAKLDGSESVLAVRTEELFRIGSWQGFYPCQPLQGTQWQRLLHDRAEFRPRTEELEHDEAGLAWAQLIPYTLLLNDGKVFCFRRPAKGGDTRLAGRLSIGVGGHINPIDWRRTWIGDSSAWEEQLPHRTFVAGLRRELDEEMGVLDPEPALTGLLRDDSNDVGRRHLGLVYTCPVDPADVRPQSAEIEPVGWLTAAELRALPGEEWETWSALLVESIDQVIRLVPV